jgi:hypothetical protein
MPGFAKTKKLGTFVLCHHKRLRLCRNVEMFIFSNIIFLVEVMKQRTGTIMENAINDKLREVGFDFLCVIFIGHGFGRGPGYLYGIDQLVN